MIEKIYFYRNFTGSEFILSKSEKTVIPVRLKNQFIPDSFVFDAQKKSWQKAALIPEENEIFQPAEFVEFPLKPLAPYFTPLSKNSLVDIEDLSPAEMAEYYIYRNDQRRYFANARIPSLGCCVSHLCFSGSICLISSITRSVTSISLSRVLLYSLSPG